MNNVKNKTIYDANEFLYVRNATIVSNTIADIDEIETIFVRPRTIKNINTGNKNENIISCVINVPIPNKKPYVVATALPPLKFANKG